MMAVSRTMLISLACIGALGACSSEPSKPPMESTTSTPPVAMPVDQGKAPPQMRAADTSPLRPAAPLPMASKSPSERGIYFDFDASLIKKEYEDLVLKHSRYLVENPRQSVVLEGNADERGSREYNLALG